VTSPLVLVLVEGMGLGAGLASSPHRL
jgi:hypothetical protein